MQKRFQFSARRQWAAVTETQLDSQQLATFSVLSRKSINHRHIHKISTSKCLSTYAMTEAEVPVPPQYKAAEVIDFRNAMLGPRGYKMARKRTIEEREEQVLRRDSTDTYNLEVRTAPLSMLVELNLCWPGTFC